MAGPSLNPFQQLLQDRVSQLSSEMEKLFREASERSRREFADQLNQAVRRMRLAPDDNELLATLADSAAAMASGAAVFRLKDKVAAGEYVRGVAAAEAEAFRELEIPLESAGALAGAVETRDPVTTITSAGAVSPELVRLAGHAADGRAFVYPVVVHNQTRALLYVWGIVQQSPVELLSQVAAAQWGALEPPAKPEPPPVQPQLVSIAIPAARAEGTWESLSPEAQQMHLRAQRFARVHAAEMRLFQSAAVQSGRARRDLYDALRKPIDTARETFRQSFFASCPSMVDYLHLELVRTLANDDAELLGKDYPGPMV